MSETNSEETTSTESEEIIPKEEVEVKKKRGRPRLYFTDEERRLKKNEFNRRWHHKHKEEIAKRKHIYHINKMNQKNIT